MGTSKHVPYYCFYIIIIKTNGNFGTKSFASPADLKRDKITAVCMYRCVDAEIRSQLLQSACSVCRILVITLNLWR